MTPRCLCPPTPGSLEDYAVCSGDLFASLAQRRGFREYLTGLPVPRDRNKTLTCLAGAEPVVGAWDLAVQRLQFFLSESRWDVGQVNDRRRRRPPASRCAPAPSTVHSVGSISSIGQDTRISQHWRRRGGPLCMSGPTMAAHVPSRVRSRPRVDLG
uniref:Transposase n=1 Tax=Streptomyces sp. NBC_00003 TaxID=2903608 RepID=A0AAU2VG06_9ACTN